MSNTSRSEILPRLSSSFIAARSLRTAAAFESAARRSSRPITGTVIGFSSRHPIATGPSRPHVRGLDQQLYG
ncbi:hypothetical protein [Embleya sp. MST-111070]|uniref:hypothetical protein n=1 Tax=Embleya sp. MST-111070 TaxID=3398231 RepID=UPI003F7384F2